MSESYPAIVDELGLGPPDAFQAVGGGCIADAAVASFADGTRVFIKRLSGAPEMFLREAEGLRALSAARAIRVPKVLAVSEDALLLEHIQSVVATPGFFADFGRRFAQLHRHTGPVCGFGADNYIGATPQPNRPVNGISWGALAKSGGDGTAPGDGADWPDFYLQRRLRFQADLASRKDGGELQRSLDRAEKEIRALLEAALEPPSLLHGDLWSGNFLVDDRGEACLTDPAVYFGHREADLAMTRLFGGFAPSFYSAYEEAFPLPDGYGERLPFYQLYHVLNHFNLFGGGYHGQARRILDRFSA